MQSTPAPTGENGSRHQGNLRRTAATGGFHVGQSVTHPKFGLGVIVSADGGGNDIRVQVNFGSCGMKWLALSMAKLEAA